MTVKTLGPFACLGLSKLHKNATEKGDPKKASFTFSRDLRPEAHEQNSAT